MRTAVVTGASSGIGLAIAQALASQGCRVIAVGRDPGRVREAGAAIVAAAPAAAVDWIVADFTDLAEVRAAAARIGALTGRIDILANNAGALFDARYETAAGHEATFAVNHLAPFLLTLLLLPALRAAGAARIVNMSSIGHMLVPDIAWDDLQLERDFTPLGAYAQSKLANILFTRALARRLAGDKIVANAVHPGLVASRFPESAGAETRAYYAAAQASGEALSAEQGADTAIWLATAPEAAHETGGYFVERKRVAPSPAAASEAGAERLWAQSAQLVGL